MNKIIIYTLFIISILTLIFWFQSKIDEFDYYNFNQSDILLHYDNEAFSYQSNNQLIILGNDSEHDFFWISSYYINDENEAFEDFNAPIENSLYNEINSNTSYFYMKRTEGLFNKIYSVNLVIRTSKGMELDIDSPVYSFIKIEKFTDYGYYIYCINLDVDSSDLYFTIEDSLYVTD